MLLAKMTDEQISMLSHVEALIAPLTDHVSELIEQGKSDRIVRAQEVAENRVQMAQLSERVGKVESRLDVKAEAESTRARTLKLVGTVVVSTIAAVAALGGFVLGILNAVPGH